MRLFIIEEKEGSERGWEEKEGSIIVTTPRIVRHAQVVRLQVGEECAIQCGDVRYVGTVTEMGKRQLVIRVNSVKRVKSGESVKNSKSVKSVESVKNGVMMAVALPNTGAKLDMIVEKLTEVGVDHIVFFSAERSQMRGLDDKKLTKLHTRALEASEQSNRWTVPEVDYMRSLDDVLVLEGEKILFDKQKSPCPSDIPLPQGGQVVGLVGPEGGWSPSEKEKIGNVEGVRQVDLGETILRMETAAIVGAWALMHIIS